MYLCLKTRSSVNARGRQEALHACSTGISQQVDKGQVNELVEFPRTKCENQQEKIKTLSSPAPC